MRVREVGFVERHEVVVVGGGQAGLAMSWHLRQRGLEHVVLERARVGERWRSERWDSLMFQFPNCWLRLPGSPYDGPDPDGFAHHSEVLARILAYRDAIDAPVREQTEVVRLLPAADGWELTTSTGVLHAGAVVAATGPFQRPHVPELAARLPVDVCQLHASGYRNPEQLPPGAVLVVGSGASGYQIGEELLDAGRSVHLAVTRHRRMPRRHRGRDLFWWLDGLGFLERTRDQWPDSRQPPSLVVTGVGGGHDVDVRQLHDRGAVLHGRLAAVDRHRLRFAGGVEQLLAAADTTYDEFVAVAEKYAVEQGLDLPAPESAGTRRAPVPDVPDLDLSHAGVSSVVWCTGYRHDLGWIEAPVVDAAGDPVQVRGVTPMPGLYFLGLHWMHTLRSGLLPGVGDDAAFLAAHLTRALDHARRPGLTTGN
jgi:putative flavoprotein involved in K+ transport